VVINDVPVECIYNAAYVYHVPAPLIISVLKTENGRKGMALLNKNGTYDLGPMQVNTSWLRKLHHYGYSVEKIRYDPCTNVAVGAWILGTSIANGKDLWRGVGDYHSHSPYENFKYSAKVKSIYRQIMVILGGNEGLSEGLSNEYQY